jgi:alkylation response protein AidB-like acyl-CoA dehydrogenase
MPSFAPTEEHEEIRRLARSLAVEQLRTQGRRSEKSGDISPELMQTLAQTGLTTPFPEAYGGSGSIEALTYALIAEELGFGDGGLAMNVLSSMMGPLTVALAGDQDQQKQYIPPFCDEREGYMQRGSLAFAERTGGYSLADVSAMVRSEGQKLVLNGTKRDVMHGRRANLRVVLVRREGTTGIEGLCAVVLPEDVDGIDVHDDAQKLGLISAPSASYTFKDAVVPASCMLCGNANGTMRAAMLYVILRAGVACGMARAALEYAGDYAKGRMAFGRPIVSYQGIAFMIAEMAMKLDAARLLVWYAATNWDRGIEDETLMRDAEAAQYQAIKIAKSATIDGVQILGGAGFLQDHPVEMWMRNAAAME